MSYQVCPLCKGTGQYSEFDFPMLRTATTCSVCEGAKIINEFTGKPPVKKEIMEILVESRGHLGITEEDLKRMHIAEYKPNE